MIDATLHRLAETQKQELIATANKKAEKFRVQVRKQRADARNESKKQSTNKDDEKRTEKNIETLTTQHIKEIDAFLAQKVAEISKA